MKATLIVIETDVDHAQAKALVEKLMASDDPGDRARMAAQTRLMYSSGSIAPMHRDD